MAASEIMSTDPLLSFSRRSVCLGGFVSAGAALLPKVVFGRDISASIDPGPYVTNMPGSTLHLRGVRVGEHAILRMHGTVTAETPKVDASRTWRFDENTMVSWVVSAAGGVVETRRGRIQLASLESGKTIEIATGPVDEPLSLEGEAVAISLKGQSLIVSAPALALSDAWDIADDPLEASLPAGLSEFRVFRTASDGVAQQVYWALRSPWLPALGEASPETHLVWRGQGRLTAWRKFDAPDFI
jgi:hypothetical protein